MLREVGLSLTANQTRVIILILCYLMIITHPIIGRYVDYRVTRTAPHHHNSRFQERQLSNHTLVAHLV